MGPSNDSSGVNDPSAFDDAIVDAPGSVLALFAAATGGAHADELVGIDAALAAFGVGANGPVAVPSQAGRRPWGRIVAAFGVASMVTVGVAAAAGSLPDGAQRIVSNGFGRVGIDVPSPDDEAGVPGSTGGSGNGIGSDGTEPPEGTTPAGVLPPGLGTVSPGMGTSNEVNRGLCRGWLASEPHGSALGAPSREVLMAAAKSAGQDVGPFCASLGVVPPPGGQGNPPVKPATPDSKPDVSVPTPTLPEPDKQPKPDSTKGGAEDEQSSSSSVHSGNGNQGGSPNGNGKP